MTHKKGELWQEAEENDTEKDHKSKIPVDKARDKLVLMQEQPVRNGAIVPHKDLVLVGLGHDQLLRAIALLSGHKNVSSLERNVSTKDNKLTNLGLVGLNQQHKVDQLDKQLQDLQVGLTNNRQELLEEQLPLFKFEGSSGNGGYSPRGQRQKGARLAPTAIAEVRGLSRTALGALRLGQIQNPPRGPNI